MKKRGLSQLRHPDGDNSSTRGPSPQGVAVTGGGYDFGNAAMSRRALLAGATAVIAATALPRPLFAKSARETPLHGLSAFGDLKYPPGFRHFDYASPDAPKGGRFHFQPSYWFFNQNTDTFNTLNSFVRRGDAPPRMELCFDSLMVRALDEPDAIYGLLAETVTISDDANAYTFKLRENARWHDGTPLTAEDVAWTYMTLKEIGHPALALPLARLAQAEAVDAATARLTFDGQQSERLILSVAGYPVLQKAQFATGDFEASTLTPLTGSGPYGVGRFSAGNFIEYERVEDYWARDLGPARGLGHFDILRIDFFADRQPAFEAFKKGDVHWREEFTARVWANDYNFPAVVDGRVKKDGFPDELRPSLYGLVPNQRRPQFADARVREAIGLAFDFEWANANLFNSQYMRSQSMFQGSPYEAHGTPSGGELALAERLRDRLPPEVFGEAPVWPATDGSGRDRTNLRRAAALLEEAGFTGSPLRRDSQGRKIDAELLIRSATFERVYNPYAEVLRQIGVNASVRLVDPAQYQARTDAFDFDLVAMAITLEATPTEDGIEQIFGSRSASAQGSYNLAGVADPAVDAIIAEIGKAKSRDELVAAMRLLDRLLRIRRDWIPYWLSANHRVAWWDMFGFAETKPDYGWPVETLWWFDEAKARAIDKV